MSGDVANGQVPCAICGAAGSRLCEKPPATYFRCGCGFIFQHPLPATGDFVAYAEAEYQGGLYAEYVRAREMKLEHFRRRLALVQRHHAPGRLLDIGCSCGYFMEVAAGAGFDVHGLEFSASAIGAATDVRSRSAGQRRGSDRVARRRLRRHHRLRHHRTLECADRFSDARPRAAVAEWLSRRAAPNEALPDGGLHAIPQAGDQFGAGCPTKRRVLRSPVRDFGRTVRIDPAFKVLSFDYLVGQLPTLNPRLHSIASAANRLLPVSVGHKWRAVNIGEILAVATPQP
jgi:hypothetical protein